MTRQADPHDRRVKQLIFTAAGRRLRTSLRVRLYDEAPGFANLTPAEEGQLRALLRRALHGLEPGIR